MKKEEEKTSLGTILSMKLKKNPSPLTLSLKISLLFLFLALTALKICDGADHERECDRDRETDRKTGKQNRLRQTSRHIHR